jgi:16S rRNA (cytidine1402-2'-O)-methyltransferase
MELHLLPLPISDEDPLFWFGEKHRNALLESSLYFVENVRTARRFIASLKLEIPISSLQFEILDKETSIQSVEGMLTLLRKVGKGVLMSEAGCPGIADPGSVLIDRVQADGGLIIPYVGPSSIILGLMGSGLNGQHFTFHGYLPQKLDDRIRVIQKLEKESRQSGATQIFIETPYRNNALWDSLISTLHPETRLAFALGLTSSGELIRQQKVKNWRNQETVLFPKIPTLFLFQV